MKDAKIREIVLRDERTEKDVIYLGAKITDEGHLQLEGQDVGETPKKFWGDSDYEYWLTIDKEYKDTVLLWLIKERFDSDFRNDSDFRDWLKKKGIPSDFYSWV